MAVGKEIRLNGVSLSFYEKEDEKYAFLSVSEPAMYGETDYASIRVGEDVLENLYSYMKNVLHGGKEKRFVYRTNKPKRERDCLTFEVSFSEGEWIAEITLMESDSFVEQPIEATLTQMELLELYKFLVEKLTSKRILDGYFTIEVGADDVAMLKGYSLTDEGFTELSL